MSDLDLEIPQDFVVFHPLIVGLLLDISLQHCKNGKRFIDIVKNGLVEWLTSLSSDDRALVWPQQEFPPRPGATVATVASYESPIPYPIKTAFQTTLECVGAEDRDAHKYLIYITDRYKDVDAYAIRRSIVANEVRRYGTLFLLLGLGEHYDKSLGALGGIYHHLGDPYELLGALKKLGDL